MRIVIDMQGAQTASRLRGIGRYTIGITEGIIRNRGRHDIVLALNGMMPDGIDAIRERFEPLLPHDNIRVWYAPTPLAYADPRSMQNRRIASIIYARFMNMLRPDAVLFCSTMEGYGDDFFITGQGLDTRIRQCAIVHDFMPHKQPDKYLNHDSRRWYEERFAAMNGYDLLLSNSAFTDGECKRYFPDIPSTAVMAACSGPFEKRALSVRERKAFLETFDITGPFVFNIGGLDERKNLSRLLAAFRKLRSAGHRYQLVLSCGAESHFMDTFMQMVHRHGLGEHDVRLLPHIDDMTLQTMYGLCDLFVFPSLEEGFGLSPLEAMMCGAPVITSNTTSLPEVVGLPEAMFDPTDVDDMAERMVQGLTDTALRRRLLDNAATRAGMFSWDATAQKALRAIEDLPIPCQGRDESYFLRKACTDIRAMMSDNADVPSSMTTVADCLDRTFDGGTPQLLIDIGNLAIIDAGTGVQRVTRNIASHIIADPPKGYEVRLVHVDPEHRYYVYAGEYAKKHYGIDYGIDEHVPIACSHRDIFLGLDLQVCSVSALQGYLDAMHYLGARLYFVVHDLLPIQYPQYFPDPEGQRYFSSWLATIGRYDGLICVSKATADAVQEWMRDHGPSRLHPISCTWSHNGADLDQEQNTTDMPDDAQETLKAITQVPSFLMVCTIEPRKGHRQALAAFERLWAKGVDVDLVMVGRKGWMMDDFVEALPRHPQYGKRLFWLSGISDAYLDKVYGACACVVMASEAEGFGLAIIEGAYHKKPLILRDIPLFREIAGEHAHYFSGLEPERLADAVEAWLELDKEGRVPRSDDIGYLTWRESTANLLSKLPLEENAVRYAGTAS